MEIGTGAAQVFGLQQQTVHDRQDGLARRGQPGQTLAGADEDIHAQLVFQFADLAADTWLRGVEHMRHLGQVVAIAGGLTHGPQLLKIHNIHLYGPTARG